jgi:hypothetical protein
MMFNDRPHAMKNTYDILFPFPTLIFHLDFISLKDFFMQDFTDNLEYTIGDFIIQ